MRCCVREGQEMSLENGIFLTNQSPCYRVKIHITDGITDLLSAEKRNIFKAGSRPATPVSSCPAKHWIMPTKSCGT